MERQTGLTALGCPGPRQLDDTELHRSADPTMPDSPPEPTASTPDDVLLVVSGEVDLATVPELRRRLGGAKTRTPELTVDLSAVTFIDCAGLRPLLEARRRQRADGGRLVLRSPSWAVVRLLQFLGQE